MAAQSTDSSQEHGADYMQTLHAIIIIHMVCDDHKLYTYIGIKTCSQEISTSVLATTLVFATIIIFILVGFLCEQRCRRKSQSCSSSI